MNMMELLSNGILFIRNQKIAFSLPNFTSTDYSATTLWCIFVPFFGTISVELQLGVAKGVFRNKFGNDDYARQREVLDFVKGLMPGNVLVAEIMSLFSQGIEASHILAMTFTTAAASEMRDRIRAVAGKAVTKELMINTFHSFSLQLCRSHAEKVTKGRVGWSDLHKAWM